MELVNKTLKAVIDGVEKDIAPATRSDNVYLSNNPEKNIDSKFEDLQNEINNNGISLYTCVTVDSNHDLLGNGDNIKFIADAPFNGGDTITINGEAIIAQTQDGEELSDGAWIAGSVVVCYLNGTTLNFKGGDGLSAADKAKLIPSNIREGVVLFEGTSKEITGKYYSDTVGIMTVGLANGAWSGVYWTGNNEWLSCTWQDHDRVQINVLKDFIGFCRTCPTTYYSGLLPREIHHFTAGTVYNVGSTGRNGAYGVAFIKIADIEST